MSVGITYTKAQIDGTAGSMWRDIENSLVAPERFAAWLAATPDATLTAAPYNYTAGEVAILKSAFVTDFTQWLNAFRGTSTITPARDLRLFGRQLWGFGV